MRSDVELPDAEATLVFEADGDPVAVAETGRQIAEACQELAISVEWTDDPEQAGRLWSAPRGGGAAVGRDRPGYTLVYAGDEICVRVSATSPAVRGIIV